MNKLSVLSDVTKSIRKQVRNKTRKSLQTLQINSVEEEEGKGNMICTDEKHLPVKEKKSKVNETVIAAEKENAPVLRRSKRKPTVADNVNPPEEPKPSRSGAKNSKLKSKKVASKSKKGISTSVKNEQKTNLNQTKLNFSPVCISPKNKLKDICELASTDNDFPDESEKLALGNSISSEVTEDSGFIPSTGALQQISPSIIFKSPYNKNDTPVLCNSGNSILTIDSPSENYWKDIAEQRRIVLEKTLHENELLHDQLAVLEAENSQLKQLVKEAEELAKVVKGIIE